MYALRNLFLKRIFSNYIEGGKEILKKILADLKTGENWNLFQICLKFLQSSGNYSSFVLKMYIYFVLIKFLIKILFLGEFLRELYFIESEFKSCILTNEKQVLNVAKYLLVEDKQIELKNVVNILKNGKFFYLLIM